MNSKSTRDESYVFKRELLVRYHELYGSLQVPMKYIVPKSDDWPEKMWGIKLGSIVNNIRTRRAQFADKVDDLISIGFTFGRVKCSLVWEPVKAAFEKYKELKGDLLIPFDFLVPSNDKWPTEAWGLKLGRIVRRIRFENEFLDHREELEEMGFSFNRQRQTLGWDVIRDALLTYKSIKGDLMVPAKFIIPYGNSKWPPKTWGMYLGSAVSRMRNRTTYDAHREELVAMGLSYDVSIFASHASRLRMALEGKTQLGLPISTSTFTNMPPAVNR